MSIPGGVEERPELGMSTAPAPASAAPPPVRLGTLGWARWAWRQLTSMRTALILLFLLALAAVPGSVLPQRSVAPGDVRAYAADHPTLFPIMDALGLFGVFASPWFSAIYLLLFISLVGCVLPRSRVHWRAMRAAPPPAPRTLSRLPEHRRLTLDADTPPELALDSVAEALRKRRWRVARGADWVAAELGHLRETGNLLFHGALVLILVAVAAGHLFGFRGDVVVAEGESFADVIGAFDSVEPGPLFDGAALPPFSLSLREFAVRYEEQGSQLGAPRDFRAEVTWRAEPGAPEQEFTIAPNHPLVVDGSKVFLTGNGYAPRFTVRDGEGRVVLQDSQPFLPRDSTMISTGVLKLPDARPEQVGIDATFLPTAVLDSVRGPISVFPDDRLPRVFLTAWTGDLGLDGGRPQSVYELDTSAMTQLRDPADADEPYAVALAPGETATLPDGAGTVTFDGVDRFVNFRIARDPGRLPALAGAVLAVTGLLLSLTVRRRRVWARARVDAGGTTVLEVAALSRSQDDGLAAALDAVVSDLGPLTLARPAASGPVPPSSAPSRQEALP